MKKKLLSLLLVLVMVLGMFPVSAMATEENNEDVVYLSISFDGKYIDDRYGKPIVYRAISLEDIAAVDLTEYGLENMLYDVDEDGDYETTALQLIIYAHEELYGGVWDNVNFDAIPGQSYFKGGVFGFTENLMYFHNGGFPLDPKMTNDNYKVGATSDHIVLEAGDFIDMASFECFGFLWDVAGGFHAFGDVDSPVDEDSDGYYDGEFRYDFAATAGEPLSFKLVHTFADLMSGIANLYLPNEYVVYYGSTFGVEENSVTTDENGNAEITFPNAGTYYIWCNGDNGSEVSAWGTNPHESCDHYMETGEPCIVSAPAYAKVTVTGGAAPEQPEECEHTWDDATCTAPKTCSVCGATEGEANGHTWDDATCTTPKTCSVCGTTEGEALGHTWTNGECTVCGTPCTHTWNNGVCTKCKTVCTHTEYKDGKCTVCENACEHAWDDATCTTPKTCSVCGATDGEASGHSWVDATCTAPKTCSVCKATEGEANGHDWNNGVCTNCETGCEHSWTDATCTAPKTCSVCGATDGEASGHSWVDATCTVPKTCSVCKVTEGEAKGHKWNKNNGTCKTCNEVCAHNSWENGKCAECKTSCKHEKWESSICVVCNIACTHKWDSGVCKTCSAVCNHENWIPGMCEVCKMGCEHNWENSECTICRIERTHIFEDGKCIVCGSVGENEKSGEAQDISAVLNATLAKQVENVPAPSFGTNYGEWTVFGLARANYFAKDNQYFKDYYTRILGYVDLTAANVSMNGALHKTKSTDNSRLIMALSSIGIDSTAVGEWDLVDAYSKNGFSWIKKQGINGTIWALIALDTGNYETSDPTIRQQCVNSLLESQHHDGGWSLVTTLSAGSNVDITGMALTALYPYRNQPEVAQACSLAIEWLSENQLENGGFPYGTGETSESCAWAIVALTEWGINPDTDPRFVKNGNSAIDNLLTYYLEDKAQFEHGRGAGANAMATDQAAYALVAYDRFVNGKNALYDMSDVEINKSEQKVVRPDSVTLEITEVTLSIGDMLDLTPTVTPAEASNQNVTWSTENENIAKVAKISGTNIGRITAKAEGTVVITVTTEDGGKTATCTVTVVSPDKAAADAVSALIADIGVVTLDSKDAIIAARAAYDALTDAQKALVENYAVLTAAEAALAALEADDKPVTPEEPEDKTITVTMRLIGAELALQDIDLGQNAYLPNYVTWIPTTAYTLDEGATVYDLWVAATEDTGICSTGAAKNYVDTVWAPASLGGYELSEFTNGYRSGWMYTINGSHPGYGLCEQGLEDGDVVIWHYVNDYAYEVHDWFDESAWPSLGDGSYYSFWLKAPDRFGAKGGGIGSPSISGGTASDKEDEDKTEEEENKKEEPATSVKPEVSVNASGEAKTEISTDSVTEVLEQISKEQSDVLEIAPEITGEATRVEVELPAAALEKVVDSGVDLKVSTPVADIKLPTEAVSGLAEQKGALSVSASANEDGAVTVNISVGGETVNEISGGIVVGIAAENISSSSVIVIVDENGNETVVKKSVADENGLAAMLNGSATIKIVDNKQEFTDTEGHWGEKGIDFASSHGLFSGVGDGKFDPQGTMTRAMMAATLFRLEDAVATGDNKFGDVPTDTWYTDAVIWAHESNIVSGTGDGFDPEGNITREQMAAMFYRYANMLGMDTSISGDTSKFSDNDKVSSWAQNAMEWAVGVGLIHGKGEDNLDPTGNATRAEVAAIYQRMIALIVK